MLSRATSAGRRNVPDPYYGDGFTLVLDLLEDACARLLDELLDESKSHD